MGGEMALIRRISFTRFSRWGENLGRVTVTKASHTDALDGTDELKITCAQDITKGDRIVWVDWRGICHEHIVDTTDRTHDSNGNPETEAVCINSVAELWDDWVDDKRPSGTAATALRSLLDGTRWKVGACDQPGSASRTFYHIRVREALAELLETWGGELETVIEHDGNGIVSRSIGIRAKRGDQNSKKRFTWTKDLIKVSRTVSGDPKTRVYGYGKGVETEAGGYGRRLTFASINGGKEYVEDAEATRIWGHPDGRGGVLPASTSYVNDQCEDPAQLLSETRAYAETVKKPAVTYKADVLDLYAFGRSWEECGVGDAVAIIDKGFTADGLRLRGRIAQIERDLITADATVTFGTLVDTMTDMLGSISQALKQQTTNSAVYDAAAGTSVGWLIQLQQALNDRFSAVGTYKVETFEIGTVYSNVPIDKTTGLPLKSTAGMWAVNINGMGIRLASSLASGGQWDWKTFITGASVTASAINTGVIRAGESYIDLDKGEVRLAVGGSTIGGKEIASTDAARTATDFISMDSDGIIVGDASGGITDMNTRLAPDGLEIRRGDEVIANFTEGDVWIGRTPTSGNDTFESSLILAGGFIKSILNRSGGTINPDTISIESSNVNLTGGMSSIECGYYGRIAVRCPECLEITTGEVKFGDTVLTEEQLKKLIALIS